MHLTAADFRRNSHRKKYPASSLSVPAYRLPRELIAREVAGVEALGVEIRCNTAVGSDLALVDLRRDFAAVILAVGAKSSPALGLTARLGGRIVIEPVAAGNEKWCCFSTRDCMLGTPRRPGILKPCSVREKPKNGGATRAGRFYYCRLRDTRRKGELCRGFRGFERSAPPFHLRLHFALAKLVHGRARVRWRRSGIHRLEDHPRSPAERLHSRRPGDDQGRPQRRRVLCLQS